MNTPGSNRTNNRRAFTLVETLIACALGVMVIISAVYVLSGAISGFERGSDQLEKMSTCRKVLEHVRRDVMEAVTKFKIEDDGQTLVFSRFATDEFGHPRADLATGEFILEEVTYCFVPGGEKPGKLVRKAETDGEETVAKAVGEITFSLLNFNLESRGTKLLAVMVEISEEVDFELTTIRTIVIPRFAAAWANQPFWVINSIANTMEFDFFE